MDSEVTDRSYLAVRMISVDIAPLCFSNLMLFVIYFSPPSNLKAASRGFAEEGCLLCGWTLFLSVPPL